MWIGAIGKIALRRYFELPLGKMMIKPSIKPKGSSDDEDEEEEELSD